MRILVTGARGFIGRALLDLLEGTGEEALVVERPSPQQLRRLAREMAPDAAVHLGFVAPDGDDIESSIAINRELQHALLDGLPSDAVAVVAGSAAEYGPVDGMARISEDVPLRPIAAYGTVKAVLERDALAHPRPVVWLRIFNVLGPGQPSGYPVADWIEQIAEIERAGGGALETGDLRPVRDFLDVRDVAAALRAACAIRSRLAANVGSGAGVSLRELAQSLCDLVPVEVDLRAREPEDLPLVPYAVADPGRFRSLTGWRPALTLDQSLRAALDAARAP
jgi:nucleoside-diphosphate-sugar epimerase